MSLTAAKALVALVVSLVSIFVSKEVVLGPEIEAVIVSALVAVSVYLIPNRPPTGV